ncbi:MAG: hypothetical protein ABSE18_03825 [Minisyncoccia bacterium]|jgi:hypothetical protein
MEDFRQRKLKIVEKYVTQLRLGSFERNFDSSSEYCLRCIPAAGYTIDCLPLLAAENHSGVLSTPYFDRIHTSTLRFQLSSNAKFFIPAPNIKEIHAGTIKESFIGKSIQIVDTGSSTNAYIDKLTDFFPSSIAINLGVFALLSDFDEIANNFLNNNNNKPAPFLFLLDSQQVVKIERYGPEGFVGWTKRELLTRSRNKLKIRNKT